MSAPIGSMATASRRATAHGADGRVRRSCSAATESRTSTTQLAAAFRPGDRLTRRSDRPARCCTCRPPIRRSRQRSRRCRSAQAFAGAGARAPTSRSRRSSSCSPIGSQKPDVRRDPAAPPTPPTSSGAAPRGRSTTRLELTPSMRRRWSTGCAGGRRANCAATSRSARVDHGCVERRGSGARRSGSSASCSRGGRTCSPTPSACCAPATRSSSGSAPTRWARRRRSWPTPWHRRWRRPGCPAAPSAWSSRPRTPPAGRCSPTGACRSAVARGSGPAVAQLGAVARQAGIPVSLHGTGGAWIVAAADADRERFVASVVHSLDRKVCNTLNVCCIVARAGGRARAGVRRRGRAAGERSGTRTPASTPRRRRSAFVPDADRSATARVRARRRRVTRSRS